MDKPTAADMPKLKTQLPDPLMIVTFGIDTQNNVIIRLAYLADPATPIYTGHVHNPEHLMVGFQQALEIHRGK